MSEQPDDIHRAWLAGWDAGYAQGARHADEDLARAILHAEAVSWTDQAVALAESRHGIGWASEIRAQAEAVPG